MADQYACPKCGNTETIDVDCLVRCALRQEQGHVWPEVLDFDEVVVMDEDPASCGECQYEGPISDFLVPE